MDWAKIGRTVGARTGAGAGAGLLALAEDLGAINPVNETIKNLTATHFGEPAADSAVRLVDGGGRLFSGGFGVAGSFAVGSASGGAAAFLGVSSAFLSGYALGSGIDVLSGRKISEYVGYGMTGLLQPSVPPQDAQWFIY